MIAHQPASAASLMGTTTVIIETSANQLYFVADYDDAALAHVWRGLRVKRSKLGFTVIGKKEEMVRKAGSREFKVEAE